MKSVEKGVSLCTCELHSTPSTLFHGRTLIFTLLTLMKSLFAQPHTSQSSAAPNSSSSILFHLHTQPGLREYLKGWNSKG